MQNYAITNKLTPFISMQNHYNLLYREEEREMSPTLKVSIFRLYLCTSWTPLTLHFYADVWRGLHSMVSSCAWRVNPVD
jgi:hypothetical protein